MDKQTVVNTYDGILVNNKNNKEVWIYTTTLMNLQGIMQSERS